MWPRALSEATLNTSAVPCASAIIFHLDRSRSRPESWQTNPPARHFSGGSGNPPLHLVRAQELSTHSQRVGLAKEPPFPSTNAFSMAAPQPCAVSANAISARTIITVILLVGNFIPFLMSNTLSPFLENCRARYSPMPEIFYPRQKTLA